LGLVAQSAGDSMALIAYLSKQLDPIYRGWPGCLKVLATEVLLIPEVQKITFNLPMTVWSSLNIQDLTSHKAINSISPSCVQILHSFLLQPDLTFRWYHQLNPATLLPSNIPPNPEPPAHDRIEVLDDLLTTFHHILNTPIPDAPDLVYRWQLYKGLTTSAARAGHTIVEGH
jgi:hypothetical protein